MQRGSPESWRGSKQSFIPACCTSWSRTLPSAARVPCHKHAYDYSGQLNKTLCECVFRYLTEKLLTHLSRLELLYPCLQGFEMTKYLHYSVFMFSVVSCFVFFLKQFSETSVKEVSKSVWLNFIALDNTTKRHHDCSFLIQKFSTTSRSNITSCNSVFLTDHFNDIISTMICRSFCVLLSPG